MPNVPLDSLWDFNASAKHGPSSPLGRSGEKLTPGRRVHAVVTDDHSYWIKSSQGKWHHGGMETPTLSVLVLNHYTKFGNIFAVVPCVPTCAYTYDN